MFEQVYGLYTCENFDNYGWYLKYLPNKRVYDMTGQEWEEHFSTILLIMGIFLAPNLALTHTFLLGNFHVNQLSRSSVSYKTSACSY